MNDLYILSSSNCTSCRDSKGVGKYITQGKPYGSNVFNIIDSTDTKADTFLVTNFFGYSIAEFGELVYKSNGNKIDLQKISFSNLDTLYLTKTGDKWGLGLS